MAWTQIPDRPNDTERKQAEQAGVGDGGEDTGQTTLRETTRPK